MTIGWELGNWGELGWGGGGQSGIRVYHAEDLRRESL